MMFGSADGGGCVSRHHAAKKRRTKKAPAAKAAGVSGVASASGAQGAFEPVRADRARQAGAVGEDHGGRAGHVHLRAELEVAVDRGGVAGAGGRGRLAVHHPRFPRLRAIRRAPDLLGLLRGIRREHRIQEGVDRDVVDRLQRAFELMAVRAVRVGEHGDLALAVSLHDLHGVFERQLREVDLVDLGQTRLGEIAVRLGVDEVAGQHVVAVGVAIDDLRAEVHFVETRDRRLGDALDVAAVDAEARLQRGLDLVRSLVGLGRAAEHRGDRREDERGNANTLLHVKHS
ncbi:hypothetical protein PT2222_210026 [Paraburkholderia tropica]